MEAPPFATMNAASTGTVLHRFAGRLVQVGFGCIGQGVLPLDEDLDRDIPGSSRMSA